MIKFQYIALNEAGQKISGALEADSEAAALRQLEERKLFPVTMHGQLADLIGSGVPLLRALLFLFWW